MVTVMCIFFLNGLLLSIGLATPFCPPPVLTRDTIRSMICRYVSWTEVKVKYEDHLRLEYVPLIQYTWEACWRKTQGGSCNRSGGNDL